MDLLMVMYMIWDQYQSRKNSFYDGVKKALGEQASFARPLQDATRHHPLLDLVSENGKYLKNFQT